MGLLDNTTHVEYYEGNDLGNYQFNSLDDIITQFQIAYVGEGKIIQKVKRADIAFHAQRGLQEFSFDTFKSIKSQQIDLPPTLVMPLPHDYVNYTKLSWADSAGIKHPLYPTNGTSNPFQIRQEENGNYSFPEDNEEVKNGNFSNPLSPHWSKNPDVTQATGEIKNKSEISGGKLVFTHRTRAGYGAVPANFGHALAVWQELDVSDQDYVSLSGDGESVDIANAPGILRLGLGTGVPDSRTHNYVSSSVSTNTRTTNYKVDMFDLVADDGSKSYIEWNTADNTTSKSLLGIDVRNHDTIYVIVVSFNEFYTGIAYNTLAPGNNIDNVSVVNAYSSRYLSANIGNETESSTWNNYKANTPSENQDDYQDDTYWPMPGQRYGLDPQHAQANGSFYIDPRLGRIHFSSNISGKTVILDYISDSLGTDDEMQVHKFAEEAMYKYIAYAILSTSSQPIHQQLAPRFKKERFAETRKAKLRLSNIKLEELTQILRGKSKQIKH